MSKRKDLTGQKFVLLVVLGLNKEKTQESKDRRKRGEITKSWIYWDCVCECGKKTVVTTQKLEQGHTVSCGCFRLKYDWNDIVGKTFGKWTVLKLITNKTYLCQCECGTIKRVRVDLLLSGNTKACGCLDSLRIDQIINKKYGHLTIIDEAEGKQKSVLCKCDCGRIVTKYQARVLNGRYTSCGKCKYKDIKIGDTFGRWTVIGDVRHNDGQVEWLCQCNCEKKTIRYVNAYSLKSGNSNGCGCEKYNNPYRIIDSEKRLHNIWHNMTYRCNSPSCQLYIHYGGRGIKVCSEWNDNFEAFKEWSLSHGYRDNLSIDRIDVNGDYEPSNCRWATSLQQAYNRRNSNYITYKNETKPIKEWSEITGISAELIYSYRSQGYKLDEIFCDENKERSV